jgi:hypothetical protein
MILMADFQNLPKNSKKLSLCQLKHPNPTHYAIPAGQCLNGNRGFNKILDKTG